MKKRTSVRCLAADFDLEQFLPYRLSLLTNTVSGGIARSYRDRHDISVTEWRILAVLGRFPGLTAGEVASRTAMDKVAISRAVKALMEKGLLSRRTDEVDRRRRKLFLTANAGETVLKEVVPRALRYETRLLAVLGEQELNSLNRILRKLQHRAASLTTE